jgi:hypothetical protein
VFTKEPSPVGFLSGRQSVGVSASLVNRVPPLGKLRVELDEPVDCRRESCAFQLLPFPLGLSVVVIVATTMRGLVRRVADHSSSPRDGRKSVEGGANSPDRPGARHGGSTEWRVSVPLADPVSPSRFAIRRDLNPALNTANKTVPYQQLFAGVRIFILLVSTNRKSRFSLGTHFF